MRITILTLFPEFFPGPLGASVLGRAIGAGALTVETACIRDFADGRHRAVDDTPYGGGAGMLMRATELAAATRWARSRNSEAPVVLLSPQGAPLEQGAVRSLAERPGLILVCGRYEGVDERYVERCVDFEVSVGDFVLSGGETAALCLVDAVARLLPGALGNAASAEEESFSGAALEYPHFTRPPEFEGLTVPDVLRSGDHGRVAEWRRRASLLRTYRRRPELLPVDARHEAAALAEGCADVPEWMRRPRHLPSRRFAVDEVD